MIAPEKLLNDENVWAQQWDALRRIVLKMLELIYSARCYLFVFDLTGSFVIFISKCYGFVFKQLPHFIQINKWKVATTMGATYTHPRTHRKIITMTTILIKHPSQWYEWWLSWWITEKNEKKNMYTYHTAIVLTNYYFCVWSTTNTLAKHTQKHWPHSLWTRRKR